MLVVLELGIEKLRGPVELLGGSAIAGVSSFNFASAASRRSKSGIEGTGRSTGSSEPSTGGAKASSEDCASSFSFLLLRRT